MPRKLLLADDSVTIQRVIELTFSGEDVQVVAVGDGEEAIARITLEKPDIILADIGMPKRNGYEVSAFVKSHPELQKIPVLLLAGAFEPVDEAKAKEARCDGVLVKPLEPQQVIARVRELMGGAKATQTPAVADIPISQPAEVIAPASPVELPKHEEPQANPEDLMDLGEQDLLPREELLPPFEGAETASEPMILDNSLDDYFDKLDEAFATINSPARPSTPQLEAQPSRQDGPVLDRDLETFDAPPAIDAPPARMESADPFAGFDAIHTEESPRVPTLDDLLADMPAAPEPAPMIDFPSPPPAPVPPSIPVAPFFPSRVEGPSIEPPDVTPTLAPALGPHEPDSGRSIIADAFSALLAAEQGDPGARPPRLPGNGSAPAVTDTMIDDVARRVIQRLALGSSDQMQAIVREVVSSVAERLVREEIDRIRRNVPRS
jgi:CheY-like chemotaxis protein